MVANSDEEATNNALRQYVLEAQRLTSTQRNVRVCVNRVTIDGQSFNAGDNVVCLFVSTAVRMGSSMASLADNDPLGTCVQGSNSCSGARNIQT